MTQFKNRGSKERENYHDFVILSKKYDWYDRLIMNSKENEKQLNNEG